MVTRPGRQSGSFVHFPVHSGKGAEGHHEGWIGAGAERGGAHRAGGGEHTGLAEKAVPHSTLLPESLGLGALCSSHEVQLSVAQTQRSEETWESQALPRT